MDLSTINAAITASRTAFEIAKTLHSLQSLSDVQAAVIPLQEAILSAQSATFSAQSELANAAEELRQAKEELARMKAWETQKQRYRLVSPWNGAIVYALRESAKDSDPPHWICTSCYENGRRSILNGAKGSSAVYKYVCPVCKSEVRSLWVDPWTIEYVPN
jgi:hypothetical protein